MILSQYLSLFITQKVTKLIPVSSMCTTLLTSITEFERGFVTGSKLLLKHLDFQGSYWKRPGQGRVFRVWARPRSKETVP